MRIMFVIDRTFKADLKQAGRVNMCGAAARLRFTTALSPETTMRRRVLTVLAALLMAAVTIQTADAARHGRKPARAAATQQHGDTRHAAPAASGTKSCDVIWCYQD
jgi:hypothetical protein